LKTVYNFINRLRGKKKKKRKLVAQIPVAGARG